MRNHCYGGSILTSSKTVNGTQNNTDSSSVFVERIAEKLGAAAKVSTVYGEPVERDGITIIPVAKVRYGFGGGGGQGEGADHTGHGEGSGGGGGVVASPVGFIEVRNGESTFRPIRDRSTSALLILAGGLASMFLFRGIAELIERMGNTDTD